MPAPAEKTEKVEANPDDHQARFDLAQALYAHDNAGLPSSTC